jgi:hypothetical protein
VCPQPGDRHVARSTPIRRCAWGPAHHQPPKRADSAHGTGEDLHDHALHDLSEEVAARRAIAALRAAGVPARDLRLLTGRRLGDVHQEPVGGYARPFGHDAPVGTFGGGVVRRRHGAGGFAGDPDQQRQGSFGDVDRVVIVTYDDDAERARVTGLRGVRQLLGRAALGDAAVARALNELQRGRAVVLVDLREIAAGEARDQLEQLARAA